MKKMFWMLGVAVAAMTSCTNDEVMEMNQNNVIKFENFVNKGTRVASTTIDNLTNFYVFGYYDINTNVLSNVEVSKSGEYETNVPWTNNQTYQFAAYATNNSTTKFDDANFADRKLTFSGYNVTDDKDLVIAYATDHQAGSDVPLIFRHKLSKIKFTLTNASVDGLLMTVSNITFKLKQKGDYNSSSVNEWTISSDATEETLTFNGTDQDKYLSTTGENSHTTGEHLVLPQKLGEITASFTASFYDSNKTLVQTVSYSDVKLGGDIYTGSTDEYWKPGYIYNYTAQLPVSPTYIKFTVSSIENWQEGQGDSGNATVNGSQGNIGF